MEMTKIVGKLDMAPMKLEIQAPMFCTQLRLKDKDEILNLKLRGCFSLALNHKKKISINLRKKKAWKQNLPFSSIRETILYKHNGTHI